MSTIKKEVKLCDICDNETNGFYYWENTTDSFGVVDESSLIIDVCEHCAREIRFEIPKNMMEERYGSDIADKSEILEIINKWKIKVLG